MYDLRKHAKKVELIESLKESIRRNDRALAYCENNLSRLNSALEYNKTDKALQEELENVGYILLVLKHTEKMYKDNLRKLGVVRGK